MSSEPSSPPDLLRRIPRVDRVLDSDDLAPLFDEHPRAEIVRALRGALDELRRRAWQGSLGEDDLELEAVCALVRETLERRSRPYYCRVVNATGVLLHTNLGRAGLADEAVAALAELAPHPQRLEVDLESGQRGGRDRGCEELLCELLRCEAATVVNNNAAATLLILAALARGKKVLLSRGEMVEIGGSYRIPEILRESGAVLAEVGTTNRTHERDYREAVDEDAGLILKVHTSNYRVVGFTSEVDVATLAAIGHEHGIPVVHDLGSGCLVDLEAHGRPGEVRVRDSLEAGADLVCFSGDKLLGGPQAGILAGRREAVDRCRRHPLFRALRPGRLIYTALEATLRLYLAGDEEALRRIPVLRRLTAAAAELRPRARELAERLAGLPGLEATAVECTSEAGSGSLPARELPSWGVKVTPRAGSVTGLAAELRRGEPAIVARISDDGLLLDLRTLDEDEVDLVERRLREVGAPATSDVEFL
jgi:L-seryl-tRNA(Ser) seleniumtransferase